MIRVGVAREQDHSIYGRTDRRYDVDVESIEKEKGDTYVFERASATSQYSNHESMDNWAH